MFAAKDTPTCMRKSQMPSPTQSKDYQNNAKDFFYSMWLVNKQSNTMITLGSIVSGEMFNR